MVPVALITLVAVAQAAPTASTAGRFHLHRLGTHATGVFDQSASEIAAFHAPTKRLWVVNGAAGIDVIDLSDPSAPRKVATHAMPAPTSVAIHADTVAVAVPSGNATPGAVRFLDLDGRMLADVAVGHGPDMCTFTPDGKTLVVANEGEPVGDADPEGSISIIDLRDGPAKATVRTADFRAFESERARLVGEGAHLPVSGASVAQQSEPEYVAISPDGRHALVTLQESNALARIDLQAARVLSMTGLGLKDFSASGLDASDADGAIDIRPWPVLGLRQPDTVVTWESGGTTWFATSNEGEARETKAFDEVVRVKDLALHPDAFPAATADPRMARDAIADPKNLGRLQVSRPACDPDGDGTAERIVAFGGRGITVWRLVDGVPEVAWDSGDQVERTVAERMPEAHNGDGKKANSRDARSTSKGPEVEGLALGTVGARRLLFAGLERSGGVMTWDVTDPAAPLLVDYVNPRDPAAAPASAGDIAPEGLLFVPASTSPNGRPLLVVCNELSGTTTIWEVREGPAPDVRPDRARHAPR
ncbi:MAG: choice-of-anchor I family protein [Phycisphaerales bacterium]